MDKTVNIIHTIALGVAFVGVVLHIFDVPQGWMVLGIGAALLLLGRLYFRARTTDKTTARQMSILVFGSLMLLVAAWLMHERKNYWVMPLLIDAAVELYVSFRLKRVG